MLLPETFLERFVLSDLSCLSQRLQLFAHIGKLHFDLVTPGLLPLQLLLQGKCLSISDLAAQDSDLFLKNIKFRLSLFQFDMGLLAASLLLLPIGAKAEKTYKLRLAAVFPPPTVSLASYATKLWMDEVTKRTGGKVTFQPFWGGALGKPAAHLTLVERGMTDVVLTHRWYTPGKLPLGQFEYVFPFGPVDPVIVTKAKRQIHEEFPQFAQAIRRHFQHD